MAQNLSEGTVLISSLSVEEINQALSTLQERLDVAKGLRGRARVFDRLGVDDAIETGDAINKGQLDEDQDNQFLELLALLADTGAQVAPYRQRLDDLRTLQAFDSGGGLGVGAGSPTDAQYVTLALNGTLMQERVLTAGANVLLTDAGANSTVTVDVGTQALAFAGDISPTQLNADTNDYAPPGLVTASTLRLSTDASRSLTGITGGADGRMLMLHNIGSFPLVLPDESIGSAAINRFALTATFTLQPDDSALMRYDSTTLRWRMVASSTVAPSIDPLVLMNRAAPSAAANQITAWAQDTDGVAGKSGMHIITEDGTPHVFGDQVGLGVIAGLTHMLEVRGPDGGGTSILTDAFNSSTTGSAFIGQHARGTAALPTVLVTADRLATLQGNGYGRNAGDTANEYLALGRVRVVVDGVDAQGRMGGAVTFETGPGVSAATAEAMRVAPGRQLLVGHTSLLVAGVAAGGIQVNTAVSPALQLANTTNIAHGMTTEVDTSAYASLGMADDFNGGVQLVGVTENLTSLNIRGLSVNDPATSKGLPVTAAGTIEFGKKSGTTYGAMGAGVNLLAIKEAYGGNGNRWLVDADGDTWQPGVMQSKGLLLDAAFLAPAVTPPVATVDQVGAWVADTDAVAGKAGLHIVTEDNTQHVIGDKVGIGVITGLLSLMHLRGPSGAGTALNIETFNTAITGSSFIGNHSGGTPAVPARLATADRIATLQGNGYVRNAADSADAYVALGRVRVVVDGVDAQGRAGGALAFEVSAGVSAACAEVARLDKTGLLHLATGGISSRSALWNGATSGTLTHLPAAITTSYGLTWPAAQGAAGSVPTNNGAGALAWSTPLSSGVVDKVAIWASATGLTSDPNLHWDSTKNSLGIGTATFGTNLNNGLALTTDGATVPTTNVADTVQLYAMDQTGLANASLFVKAESGEVSSLGARLLLNTLSIGTTGLGGMFLENGSSGGALMQLSDNVSVAHGMTTLVPTTVFGDERAISVNGGVQLRGYTETHVGVAIGAFVTTDPDTSKTSGATAAILFECGKKSGTGAAGMAAGVNLVRFTDNLAGSGNRWILDNDGDTWQGGRMQAVGALLDAGAAPSATANQVGLWVADTDAVAGKAGLHVMTEDGTTHVFGDQVGIGITTALASFLHVAGPDASAMTVTLDAFMAGVNGTILTGRHARGTRAVPAILTGTDNTLAFNGAGYVRNAGDTANAYTTLARQRFMVDGLDAQNRGGGAITFETSAGVSADPVERMRLDKAGLLTLLTGGVSALSAILRATSAPSAVADQVTAWVADTDAIAGKAGLHLMTEDATAHVFGDQIGLGITSGLNSFLHIAGPAATGMTVTLDAWNAGATGTQITGRHARGSRAVPALLVTTDILVAMQGNGYVRNAGNTADAYTALARIRLLIDSVDAQGRAGGAIAFANGPGVSAAAVETLRITEAGNLLLGTTSFGTSAAKAFVLANGTAPSTSPADMTQLWSADRNAVAGKSGLHIRTETGTEHVLADAAVLTRLANGQAFSMGEPLTELLTIAAAATSTTAIQIPAGAVVLGVSVRVTTAIPTATTFSVGVAAAATRYGTGLSVAVNTTNPGTDDATRFYAAATAILITPNVTPGTNAGRLRVTIHYYTIVVATS